PPMVRHLHVAIGTCRPQLGCDTAELELKYLGLPHRRGGLELLPACIGMSNKFVESALGGAYVVGGMHQWKKLRHRLGEPPPPTWRAAFGNEENVLRDQLALHASLMRSRAL